MVEFDFNRVLQSDGNFICLDDSLKYRIMAIKTNKNFTPFSNSVTFRKPRGMDLVTASELIPGFCRSKSNVPTLGLLRTIKSPTGGQSQASNPRPLPALPPHEIYIDRCITKRMKNLVYLKTTKSAQVSFVDKCLFIQHRANILQTFLAP